MVKTVNNYNGARQVPLNVPFTGATTAEEILTASHVDLTNKIVVLTGGYVGLGLEVTRVLVKANATIIIGARRIQTAKDALQDFITAGAKIEIEQLDLSHRESVIAFAEKFLASNRPIDILINNAGISQGSGTLARDAQGNELILSTNHLGHFLLTNLLFPALKRAVGIPRVVNTSSMAARLANVEQLIQDPNFNHHDYDGQFSYGQSKGAQVLFTAALDARAQTAGIPLSVFAVHPGIIQTEITRDIPREVLETFGSLLQLTDEHGNPQYDPNGKGTKTIPQGAASIVFAAVYPQLDETSGVYIDNNNIVGIAGPDVNWLDFEDHGITQTVLQKDSADKFWTVSEQLTGVKFNVE